jgi:hypothetical protein
MHQICTNGKCLAFSHAIPDMVSHAALPLYMRDFEDMWHALLQVPIGILAALNHST